VPGERRAHTGMNEHRPSLIIEPAARYPDLTYVLCHVGFAVYADEAFVAARTRENIVLEPSWCQTYMVREMVGQVGAERVLFGSDHISVELTKFRSIGLTDRQLEQIFSTNPRRILSLNETK
jgi:predicted TIM-barrel fold metal-dependent hydrolase